MGLVTHGKSKVNKILRRYANRDSFVIYPGLPQRMKIKLVKIFRVLQWWRDKAL